MSVAVQSLPGRSFEPQQRATSSLADLLGCALHWWGRTSLLLPGASPDRSARAGGGGWVAVNRDAPRDRRVNAALAPLGTTDPAGWLERVHAAHRDCGPPEVAAVTRVWTADATAVLLRPGWRARRFVAGAFTGLQRPPVHTVSVRPCGKEAEGSHVDRVAGAFEDRLAVWRGVTLRADVSASTSAAGVWLRLHEPERTTPSERLALLAAAGCRWSSAGPVGVLVEEQVAATLHQAGFSSLGTVWQLTRS
jgi:hypothetical protein